MPGDGFVRVLSTPSVPEGYLAKARLEDEGIPVLMKGGAEGPYRFGPVDLFVPEGFVVQARLVLETPVEIPDDVVETDAEGAADPRGPRDRSD